MTTTIKSDRGRLQSALALCIAAVGIAAILAGATACKSDSSSDREDQPDPSSDLADTDANIRALEGSLPTNPQACVDYIDLCERASSICAMLGDTEDPNVVDTCAGITQRCEANIDAYCSGASGGGASGAGGSGFSIAPSTATVIRGDSLALSTTPATAATWSIDPTPTCISSPCLASGSAASNTFTGTNSPGVYTIAAHPAAGVDAIATITVPAVAVTSTPTAASVPTSTTISIYAVVDPTTAHNTDVNWTIVEPNCGTISPASTPSGSGTPAVYVPPASVPTPATCTVRATPQAQVDGTAYASTTITVTDGGGGGGGMGGTGGATGGSGGGTGGATGGSGGGTGDDQYFVSHSGTDNTSCGSISSPCRTIRYAMLHGHSGGPLQPDDTLNIRGGTSADTNTACASDGAQGGACWTEHYSCNGLDTTMCWGGGSGTPAGTSGNPITVQCYGSEVCILEPAHGGSSGAVVWMDAGYSSNNAAACSFITFRNLIMDNRRAGTGMGTAFRVDGVGDGGAASTMCRGITITGDPCTGTWGAGNITCQSKIRHGQYVAGISSYAYQMLVENTEFYENGCQETDGDHDHDAYIQGLANTFRNNRMHHSMQAVQIWDTGQDSAGSHVFVNNEIDHQGCNAWCGATRNGGMGWLGVYGPHIGSGTQIGGSSGLGNWIHDNPASGCGASGIPISIGDDWGDGCPTGATATYNNLWNNTGSSDGGGIGQYGGCSGNTVTPNYGQP